MLPPVMVSVPPALTSTPPPPSQWTRSPPPPVITPPKTVSEPLSSSFHMSMCQAKSLQDGLKLCGVDVLLSWIVRSPSDSTLITLTPPVISSTLPFKSSVTVRLIVSVVLMVIFAINLTVSFALFSSAAVSSSAVATSLTPFATGSAAYSPFRTAAASFPDALSGEPGPSVDIGGFVSCPVSAADTGVETRESTMELQSSAA